ncbi:MAG: protocatechuate 3,4-dioxygenase beta subunit [Lentimonas sp.]|jgi:protocatechuate 3,4-dioxygenase beta subunit
MKNSEIQLSTPLLNYLLARLTFVSKARIINIIRLSAALIVLLSSNAIANSGSSQKSANELFNPKDPTPERLFSANLSMPEKFNSTNNLVQKTGSFYGAFGEVMFLQGTITDSFNLPIEGAIVEIWQANSAGKYHSLLIPTSELIDENFNMSGRSVTDNLGKYSFTTIVPGFYLGRTPHINVNVYHPKFGKLETEIYFEDHPKNKKDSQYLGYSKEDRKLLTAKVRLSNIFDSKSTKIVTFDMVMKGVHQYKNFGN